MTVDAETAEAIERHLQCDPGARVKDWRPFLDALRRAARLDPDRARAWAARAVDRDLDHASLRSLRKVLANGERGGLRVAVLGGSTADQLVELLEVFLAAAGVECVLEQGAFGSFRQELLAPVSGLDAFRPQVVFLATGVRDLGRRPSHDADSAQVEALVDQEYDEWHALWTAARERWGAIVLQNTFEPPPWEPLGHHALRRAASASTFVESLDRAMAERAPAHVVLHDLRQLVLEYGAGEWFDPRFYFEAKLPCGPRCLPGYAHSVAALLAAIAGRARKAVVVDLDNTLWGGVVGDAGAGGIELGQGSGAGEAFLAFQHHLRELRARGVLLCVCSKNDEDKAQEPFRVRRDMVLRLDDFACFVANWRNKPDNLRDIAARLSLGLDALVFVDDNPAERALVRRTLPEVAVPELPEDPAGYVAALARGRWFETTALTAEDLRRAESYRRNADRAALAASVTDLDSFMASLEMRARIEPVHALNIERVTQLVNKSNQFNLTTRRYTLPEVRALSEATGYRTVTISLEDRFGDNGLISVLFLRLDGKRLEIELWLMSCRVLQRGVEHLALDTAVAQARALACDTLAGRYIPTAKNGLVQDLYPRLGFRQDDADGPWILDVADHVPARTFISVEN